MAPSKKRVYNDPQELIALIQGLPSVPVSDDIITLCPPSPKRIKLDPIVVPPGTRTAQTVAGDDEHPAVEPVATVDTSPNPITDIPLIPHLYHLALTAHHAASTHLQQVFIPSTVSTDNSDGFQPVATCVNGENVPFVHDPQAVQKSLGLLLLSLDLLKLGLASREISEVEKVHFGLEFGQVGVKVLRAHHVLAKGKGNEREMVDVARVKHDVREYVVDSVSVESVDVAIEEC
jgi:hypothetical protein